MTAPDLAPYPYFIMTLQVKSKQQEFGMQVARIGSDLLRNANMLPGTGGFANLDPSRLLKCLVRWC